MSELLEKLAKLKKERDAIILAHYYVEDEVQKVADYIGDSYYLSKIATTIPEKVIVFAGVNFMADSAKILNPEKIVLLPDVTADCPMAHMVTVETIKKVKEMYDDVAVVCYINSAIELKAVSDVCVTSANAVKVTKALPNKNIFFVPDKNLAHFVAEQIPEKHFIYNDGFCHVHNNMSLEFLLQIKEEYPNVKVLAHPECPRIILENADYVGSTSGIIQYAKNSDVKEFLVLTEIGVLHELEKQNPDKTFYYSDVNVCPNMKKITLQKVVDALETMSPQIEVDDDLRQKALTPLERMLELAK